jgi:tetratricopeptide (TPR) repeat protein
MKEKYLHSMGAHLCDGGKFDQAIRYFRRALAFRDESFTHYHLGLAYEGKGEHRKAAKAITRATELNPSVPEYYYERSLLWRKMGDEANASADLVKTLAIDANYGRIEEIRVALKAVEKASEDGSILECSCPVVSCPAYCCHFAGDLALHGVHIGAWKLRSIQAFLKDNGLPEEKNVEKMAYGGEKHLRMLIPPHYALRQGDKRFVYYPARGPHRIDRSLLKDLPKGRDYRTLAWITEDARPCAFLQEKRCMIHDTGDEAALEPCKQFLCLTGLVFVVLTNMGLIDEERISCKEMAELNGIALQALLLLAKGADGSEALGSFLKRQNLAPHTASNRYGSKEGLFK